MDEKIINQIKLNEYHYTLMCAKTIIKDNYVRFYDDELRDMWDLNYTELKVELTPEIYQELEQYKIDRKESHLKIVSDKPILDLKEKGFDIGCTLVMAATTLKVNPPKIQNITFKNSYDHPEIMNDVLNMELKYYGEMFGYDFEARQIYRHYLEMIGKDNYYYLACYYKGINIGQCYAFYSDGVVVIDGLIVEEEYRHLNIASNIILYIKNTYNCPIYLHAYEEEDAKNLYDKIGFEIIYKEYDHLLLDKKD